MWLRPKIYKGNQQVVRLIVKNKNLQALMTKYFFWSFSESLLVFGNNNEPEGHPNNLQSARHLVELFFWSDLSWSQADLCANSYVISTRFSLLSSPPSCMRYISNVGIKTGLINFQNFPYVTTFLLRSISFFYLWKTEWFWKELSPSETVIFGPRDFGKRSFSEILDQCNFGKNGVWRKFSDNLLSHLLSKNTWTSTILDRMESYKFFRKAYYFIYLIQTPSWQIWTRTIPERIDSKLISTFKSLNKTFQQSLHIIFAKQHLFSLI